MEASPASGFGQGRRASAGGRRRRAGGAGRVCSRTCALAQARVRTMRAGAGSARGADAGSQSRMRKYIGRGYEANPEARADLRTRPSVPRANSTRRAAGRTGRRPQRRATDDDHLPGEQSEAFMFGEVGIVLHIERSQRQIADRAARRYPRVIHRPRTAPAAWPALAALPR